MDKQQQNLDPKLKEIYERVMGTNVTSAPPTQPAPVPAQSPGVSVPQTTTPPAVSALPTPPAAVTPSTNQAHVQQKTAKATTFVAQHPSSSKTILPILYIIGGIIFLLVYTIFWMRVFGIPIPFFE